MQTISFALTRNDFAELQKRCLARARTQWLQGRRGGTDRGHALRQTFIWFAVSLLVFAGLRMADGSTRFGPALALALGGLAAGVLLAWVIGRLQAKRLTQAMIADDGWVLSPQTIALSEDGIEQRSLAAVTQWRWAGFRWREESPTLVFLFVDNAVCVVIPKTILSADEKALLEQRVPLR